MLGVGSHPERRTPQHASRRLPSGFATIRDALTFTLGMAIIVNEVFVAAKVEPAAVAIGAALAGLPLVFSADERRRSSSPPPREGS